MTDICSGKITRSSSASLAAMGLGGLRNNKKSAHHVANNRAPIDSLVQTSKRYELELFIGSVCIQVRWRWGCTALIIIRYCNMFAGLCNCTEPRNVSNLNKSVWSAYFCNGLLLKGYILDMEVYRQNEMDFKAKNIELYLIMKKCFKFKLLKFLHFLNCDFISL